MTLLASSMLKVARCTKCGRLIFRYAPGTVGEVEAWCRYCKRPTHLALGSARGNR